MVFAVFLVGLDKTLANPQFLRTVNFGTTATTTLIYMTPGTATTTYTLTNSGDNAYDYAIVAFQVTATSTGVASPTVRAIVEHSYDGVDWYNETVSAELPTSMLSAQATTTNMTSDPYFSYSFKVSSTTQAVNASNIANGTKFHYTFKIDTQLKHVRVRFYIPSSGGNVGLWGDIVGRKQIAN